MTGSNGNSAPDYEIFGGAGMARPRVFISSTFYDLRHVRSDIERFVSELGYDAVANERGDIPYGSDEALEEYCYKEVSGVDILVSVLGGRFGSESQRGADSISQTELRQALSIGKQVYIFIDADVYAELKTYKKNKGNAGVSYAHVDDDRVFSFIEEMESLRRGNPIFGFRNSADITSILKEQMAGLFQRLLSNSNRQEEVRLVESLKSSTQSLQDTVKYLQSTNLKNRADENVLREILLPSHPMFQSLERKLGVKYRIYFQNKSELDRFLSARGFKAVEDADSDAYKWVKAGSKVTLRNGRRIVQEAFQNIEISSSLFGQNGDLKIVGPAEWQDAWISVYDPTKDELDDEIPF